TLKTVWLQETLTLANAYAPRPDTTYLVDNLFALPSLNILYGNSGTLKSMILADLAMCIATGRDWLQPLQHEAGIIKPKPVVQAPVLWIDFDNGRNRTLNRFRAFGRTYQAPENSPVNIISFPSAPFDATKTGAVIEVSEYIQEIGAKFVIVDNLLTVSGGKDENSAEIAAGLINLRFICEQTGSAIVVIHHSRKDTGFRGRTGDDIRGHSSIRGEIDLALFVHRDDYSDIITMKSTKTRDNDVDPFGALWTYTHNPNGRELETAAFFGQKVQGVESSADIENAIIEVLTQAGKALNQSELLIKLKAAGVQAGRDRVRGIANRMVNSMALKTSKGAKGAITYSL
ncbi:MAG: AAA family ATPase, partial [Desulfitobacterium hafniense]